MKISLKAFSRGLACLFLVVFAFKAGFYIDGDAYFLGKHLPYSEVTLPFSGVLLYLIFLGHYRSPDFKIRPQEILGFLLFIVGHLVLAFWAQDPQVAASQLALWVTAFLILPCRPLFSLESQTVQRGVWSGLLGMALLSLWFPTLISQKVLCLGAIWIWVQTLQNPQIKGLFWITIVMGTFFWFFHQLGFLMLAFLLLFGINLWTSRSQRVLMPWQWVGGLGFLLVLIFSEWSLAFWNFEKISPIWRYWSQDWMRIFFGSGDQSFYHYYATSQEIMLNPGAWFFPQNDALLTLFEKGIFGLLMFILLAFFPVWRKRPHAGLRTFIALFTFLFVSQIWSSGVGIMTLGWILLI